MIRIPACPAYPLRSEHLALRLLSPFEQGEIRPDLFQAACRMGLEGLVSKLRDRPYQAGRSKHWIKAKHHKHPAMGAGALRPAGH